MATRPRPRPRPCRRRPGLSVEQATLWCLEHLDAHDGVLVGITPGSSSADFHIVPLAAGDVVNDVATLSVPSSWEILVVVCDGQLLGEPGWSRLALGIDEQRNIHFTGRRFATEGAK